MVSVQTMWGGAVEEDSSFTGMCGTEWVACGYSGLKEESGAFDRVRK